MSYCLNPNCQKPQNQEGTKFCLNCGSKLLLKERYRAIKVIGQSGFGKTILAVEEDKPSKPRCVIQQFLSQAQGTNNAQKATELFEQEAVRLDDLGKHPQIPELLAHFQQDNQQYLVQELIEGPNLAQILEAKGAFNELQVRRLLSSLLQVLQFIHSHKVIHYDIKPKNIILRRDGQLVLVDFGAAKYATVMTSAITGRVIGDFRYIAPEQAVGKAELASNLYSLGIICIHLLTKKHPFDLYSFGEDMWVWRDYLTKPVSDELGRVLDKLIEKATKRRYQSASEVIVEVQKFASLHPQPTQTAPKLPPPASNPQTLTWKCVHTLRHVNWVFCVAISPDGQIIASGSRDKDINIWHLDTGKLLHTLTGHTQWVRCLTFSPDGQTIVSGGDDSSIKIWQVSTGKLLNTFTLHSAPVWSVSISPDGQTLVSGSKDNSIKISHLDTGRFKHLFKGHSDSVYSTKISPDGQLLATSSYDKTIKLWHLNKKRLLHTLKGHSSWVTSLAISLDGQILASGGYDKTIKLWQLDTGKELATLTGHHSYVWSVFFSPDGKTIASASADHTVKLWQVDSGKRLCTLSGHSDWVNSVAFSPQAKTIVSGSNDMTVKIWRCD
ncbi:protein kinase domain-containing protein [Argonema antarcticum]|uniref:protein kinase domain-containing protein n=1 Tax=Argonema antarcticum TaxID=2942763 RepID=UPI002011C239|nr:protein kinase [Argonema antarcticum]MCL1470702.1 serine/threonine protein kinase [Argonema antarcticum A004/B2]